MTDPYREDPDTDNAAAKTRGLQYGHELATFARVARGIQQGTGCFMAEAKAEAARVLGTSIPSDEQFNRGLMALGVQARRARGRPPEAFPAAVDAAILFRELCRRGLTWRQSEDAILHATGINRSVLEKYRPRADERLRTDTETHTACAVGVFFDKLNQQQATLEQPARRVVGELLRDTRKRPDSN